jgi:tetratricopeptide (TPR) repeat protein
MSPEQKAPQGSSNSLGVRRLQAEVARDPGSLAFVPLADLYRVQGRLDIARRVCVRGLHRHPTHVEAHYVLGRIYRDAADVEKAYDEWDIALRLDPLDLASRRAIAFLCIERGNLEEAERHVRQALALDPDDPRLRRALRIVEGGGRKNGADASYWENVHTLLEPRLEGFLRESRVRFVLILDGNGRVVSRSGNTGITDIAALASLAAGANATSAEIARVTGQPGFTQLYQGRGEYQLFMGKVPAPAGELLLLCVFGIESTIGLVRMLFRDFVKALPDAAWPPVARASQIENLEAELAAGLARLESRTRPGYWRQG